MFGVVCKDELGDGWEEEGSGDGRTATRGDNCSGVFNERTETAEDNIAGVLVSAETAGMVPVFGVAFA